MRLKGKSAIVSGGGSGIGLAIGYQLAEQGCQVLLSGRTQAKLDGAVAARPDLVELKSHVADVSDRVSVDALVRSAVEKFGQIDILVNAAGINIPNRSMRETALDEWDRVLATNATGAFNCMSAVLPAMRERGDGLIVNVSSIAGKRATPLGGVAYNASKFAQTALGVSVGAEVAPEGVRVTNIYPGEVDTPILQQRAVPPNAEHLAGILQPEDVAAAVLMVACLPPRARVAELVIVPTQQIYV